MRALKAVTIIMAVLIVLGTALLGYVIVHRLNAPGTLPVTAASLTLPTPSGTRIIGIAAAGPALAVALSGGGPDRILLLDFRTLKPITTLTLSPTLDPPPRNP